MARQKLQQLIQSICFVSRHARLRIIHRAGQHRNGSTPEILGRVVSSWRRILAKLVITMTTPRSETERPKRKAISKSILKEALGLDQSWIDRWEENGSLQEESFAPEEIPGFIEKSERKEIEELIDRLVVAGCHRRVIYFCLKQLSPAAKRRRSGDHRIRKTATREDIATVASRARSARKQIHRFNYELSLAAESLGRAIPAGLRTPTGAPEEALSIVRSALSWVADLADAYSAPMMATLMKSKGLLYLTEYVVSYADETKLRSPRSTTVRGDSKKASDAKQARKKTPPEGNVLANLLSKFLGENESKSPSELKEKLDSFRRDHPDLYKVLRQNLAELHRYHAR